MPVRWLLTWCVAVSMSTTQLQAQSLLIRGGTLIDGSGGAPIPDAHILIHDGLIADITRRAPARSVPPRRPVGPRRAQPVEFIVTFK